MNLFNQINNKKCRVKRNVFMTKNYWSHANIPFSIWICPWSSLIEYWLSLFVYSFVFYLFKRKACGKSKKNLNVFCGKSNFTILNHHINTVLGAFPHWKNIQFSFAFIQYQQKRINWKETKNSTTWNLKLL